jgi:hypothetical protein
MESGIQHDQDRFVLSFTRTPGDEKELKFFTRPGFGHWLITGILVFALGLLLLVVASALASAFVYYFRDFRGEAAQLRTFILIALVLLTVAAFQYLGRRPVGDGAGVTTVRIGASGIEISTRDRSLQIYWSGISGISVTDNLMVLFTRETSLIPVPLRAFRDEQEFRECYSYIGQMVARAA